MSRRDLTIDDLVDRFQRLETQGKGFRQPRGYRFSPGDQADLARQLSDRIQPRPPRPPSPPPPKGWQEIFPGKDQIGTDYLFDWDKSVALRTDVEQQTGDYLRGVLAQHGYVLEWHNAIFVGNDRAFDHSVWRVERPYSVSQGERQLIFGDIFEVEKYGAFGIPAGQYACKIVSLNYYLTHPRRPSNGDGMSWAIGRLLNEAQTLHSLNHPSVVKAYDYVYLPDRGTGFPYPHVGIIMELMNGTLAHLINMGGMSLNLCRIWFVQVARGLQYIHNNLPGGRHMTHNSLIPRNILYKQIGTDQFYFKMGDFENCKTFSTSDVELTQPYFYSNDIIYLGWCFLMALYGVLAIDVALEEFGNTSRNQFSDITAYDLIASMVYVPQEQVPTIDEVLENPWVIQNIPQWLQQQ